MPWYGTHPDDEKLWTDNWAKAKERAYYNFGSWDPPTIRQIAGISRQAPWARPGVTLGLARSGAPPQVVEKVTALSAYLNARSNPTNKGPLDPVNGAELNPGDRKLFEKLQQRRAFYNQARDYVGQQISRGAEAKQTRELKDAGILDDEGMLNSPVSLEQLAKYRENPAAYAQRRPNEAGRISKFLSLTRRMAGSEGTFESPYGGAGPRTSWREVYFKTPDGVGAYRPPVAGGPGGYFVPEAGVQQRGLIDTATAMSIGAVWDSPQVQALLKAKSFLTDSRNRPGIDLTGGAAVPEAGLTGGLKPIGGAVSAGRGALGNVLEPIGRIEIPQATFVPGVAETQTLGPTGAKSLGDISQYGFAALNLPYQELQGQIRNVYGQATGRAVDWWEPQSDFAIMLGGKDPGGGFFVNDESAVGEERRRREAERGMLYGQRVTFGRLIAAGAVEAGITNPDDTAYRVLSGLADGALALYADPTILAAGKLASVNEARGVFAAERLADIPEHLSDLLGIKGMPVTQQRAFIRQLDMSQSSSKLIRSIARTIDLPGRNIMKADELRQAVTTALPRFVEGENLRATGTLRGVFTPNTGSRTYNFMDRVGALRGDFANGVHGMTATAFFQGGMGRRLVDAIAETDDAGKLYFLTNGRLSYKELRPLKEATNSIEVEEALRPYLGAQIRSTKDLWRPGFTVNPRWQVAKDVKSWIIREAGDVPQPGVELTDEHGMIPQLVDFMRNVNMRPEEQFRLIDQLVGTAGDDVATLDTWEDAVQTALRHIHGEAADKYDLAKSFFNDYRRARDWLTKDAADPSVLDEMVVGGKAVPVGNTNSFAQLNRAILPLGDPRDWRRAAVPEKIGNILNNPLIRKTETTLGWIQDQLWKPLVLLRFAWAMRVIPEEQLRMAARGHASVFKDPAGMISFLVGHKRTITGDLFSDLEEFKKVVHQSAGWMLGDRPGLFHAGRTHNVAKGASAEYGDAVLDEFRVLSKDDLATEIVKANTYDEGAARFVNGDLSDNLRNLRNPKWVSAEGRQEAADNTIAHIQRMTREDSELIDVIRTGKFRGNDIFNEQTMKFDPAFRKALRNEKFAFLPDTMPVPLLPEAYKGERNKSFVNLAFRWLMGYETAYLSRSPEFRQAYWDRVRELIGFGNQKAKDDILAQAEAEFRRTDRHVPRQIRNTEAKGNLTLEQMDNLAKSYAIDDVKTLLYDLQKRSQVADQIRLISPFAEAWKEVVTRWADLAFNPTKLARAAKNLHRFDQVVRAAQGQDLGDVMGAPRKWDPEKERFVQQGFFWKDEFGEQVFNYPGSQWLTGALTKVLPGPTIGVPLTGRVQGLNMIGQVFPGIGPVAQMPVVAFLDDKPGWQRALRGALLPFGSIADAEGTAAWFNALNYAPPWLKSGVQALSSGGFSAQTNRAWAVSVMATANYLYSTGRYDTSTESGQSKLIEDARRGAQGLYMVKALVSFGAPTSPRVDWMVKSENQGLLRLAMLRDDYYQLVRDDPKTADDLFLERWGDSAGMTMQAFTREITGGLGVSKEWGDWSHTPEARKLKEKFPATWAFHGPQGGKFDYSTYFSQLLKGQRETLDIDEYMALGQQHLGSMLMDQAREKVAALVAAGEGTESDYSEWLHDWEDFVYESYPGYTSNGEPPKVRARYQREDVMRELGRALNDPKYAESKTGAFIMDYFGKRMTSIAYAHDELGLKAYGPDYSLQSAKGLADDRRWLYDWGTYYADQDDGFKAIWNRYLRSEVEPSDEELAQEEAA